MINPGNDRLALDLLIRGFQVSRMIRLVADIAVADKLPPETARGIAEIASACGVLPGPLLRVVRALAAFGIFRLDANETIAHTPRSLLLRKDVPDSLYCSARFWTTPGSWRAWEVLDAALDGGVPHERAWGTGRFAYLRDHPEEARIFDEFMANFPDNRHRIIAAAYDFSTAGLIADIGGGNGEALRQILARHPQARGIVFDRADVVTAIPADALADGRIATQAGSFFDPLPNEADHYMLVRVLHDWSDEDAARILSRCRAAMRPGARLLVVEGLLQPDPASGLASEYLIDMQMMAMFGAARERSEAEFRDLLDRAGFDLLRVISTPSAVSILEAAPR